MAKRKRRRKTKLIHLSTIIGLMYICTVYKFYSIDRSILEIIKTLVVAAAAVSLIDYFEWGEEKISIYIYTQINELKPCHDFNFKQ